MTIKQQRYTAFWLYTIFALIIPIILVLEKFNFFNEPKGKTIGLGAIIIIFLVIFYFRHHITQWIDDLEPCVFKHVVTALKELTPLLIAYATFAFLSIQFVNVSFIMKWSCLSNLIAIGIRVWHLKCIAEMETAESEGN